MNNGVYIEHIIGVYMIMRTLMHPISYKQWRMYDYANIILSRSQKQWRLYDRINSRIVQGSCEMSVQQPIQNVSLSRQGAIVLSGWVISQYYFINYYKILYSYWFSPPPSLQVVCDMRFLSNPKWLPQPIQPPDLTNTVWLPKRQAHDAIRFSY